MILLPAIGDNAAIAARRLDPGESHALDGANITIRDAVLEGHRVAARDLPDGALILSWGLPFGRALRPIKAGEWLCNARILDALRERRVEFKLPEGPNFENHRLAFELDEKNFRPGAPTPRHPAPLFFEGFLREGKRGAGTRNFVVVLAASSRANSVVRAVAEAFQNVRSDFPNVDGVAAVTHTEGGGPARPNNHDLVVRTLRGFLANPNVAGFVAIDGGAEPVNNRALALADPPGVFISIGGNHSSAVARGIEAVRQALPGANTFQRTAVPLSSLRIGLQCGGSDAFSGVSGNPLVAWMAREAVRFGGAANLAETDELIGAESWVLRNVRDLATARAFLDKIARFQERAGWHGHSAEGNPSGGNLFRGLYNITVKSIGAALKKTADTRLDYVIDYGEPMAEPGFYFMDSPGNDLESIAGQVASGCNMILFATGNGSITNFPFVPTVKVMTTTGRFELLRQEMDFNAGRHIDGESLDSLGAEAFELMLRIASGATSAGEKAGHAQAQIWRDWRQSGPGGVLSGGPLSGKALETQGEILDLSGVAIRPGLPRVNLIVPTSLCSGQVAQIIAGVVRRELREDCVALPHTEGCGNSGGDSERLMLRTLAGYAVHPLACRTLMLEHGCEKTHNDAFRSVMSAGQIARLGWASIQSDGGLDRVTRKAVDWFRQTPPLAASGAGPGVSKLRVGFLGVDGPMPDGLVLAAQSLAAAGALVVIPENDRPSIEYGEPAPSQGLHGMRTPTEDATEALTGLGATGVEIIVAWVPTGPIQGHPFISVLQVGPAGAELRLPVHAEKTEAARQVLDLVFRAASGESKLGLSLSGHADFQITRGLEGVSL